MPLISLIIPVYHAERYLRQCLDSVAAQTLTDFEAILVDDGSTDSSGAICDQYAAADPRFRVIHQKNGGQNAAIKTGLSQVQAELIAFSDSDDWVDANYLEGLYQPFLQHPDCDLSMSNQLWIETDRSVQKADGAPEGYYDRPRIEAELFPNLLCPMTVPGSMISPLRVGKLFRRPIFEGLQAYYREDVRIGEDGLSSWLYAVQCRGICILPHAAYHYRKDNPNSVTTAFPARWFSDQAKVVETLTQALPALCGYDFSSQLQGRMLLSAAAAVEAARPFLFTGRNRELRRLLRDAVCHPAVTDAVLPYAASRGQALKYHWIGRHRVELVWILILLKERYARLTGRR